MTAPNPLAVFPVPTTTESAYRMGPLFEETPGVDFWWNTQHADGTFTACDEPPGWEGLDYITPVDQVGGRDGGLLGPSSIGPRTLNVQGMLSADTPELLRQKIAELRRILGPQTLNGPRQPVIWEQYSPGYGERVAMVTRPVGTFDPYVAWGGTVATVRFTLTAANPVWKYLSGAFETMQVGLLNPTLVSGRTYDKTYPFTYGTSVNPGGEMVVVNRGNIDAYPIFTIRGPANIPIITNATTGASFRVNAIVAPGASNQVVIDARTGSVTPGFVRLTGRPFTLAPGPNTIRWRIFVDSAYDPAAFLRLDWRSTYS